MSLDAGTENDGYPPRHWDHVRRMRALRASLLRATLATGGVALFLGWGYVRDWPPALLFVPAPLAALIFLFFLWQFCVTGDERHEVRILPYFQKGHVLDSVSTFLDGEALARNCVFLDDLARREGLEPLSDFGFADDLAGETPIWHDAGLGLATVVGLRAGLERDPAVLGETSAVIADLAPVEANLREAARQGIPFCFLLRHGSIASGHEMEVRKGFFCYGGPGQW